MTDPRFDPGETSNLSFERVPADLVEQAARLSAATLHEAGGRIGVMPTGIKPLRPDWRICGPVFTVQSPAGDNLWLHRAIYAAQPGDVLVVHCSGGYDFGYWGEVMATAAVARGLRGLVIDGGIRDSELLREMPFPVFARNISIRGTGKDFGARGWLGAPTMFDGLTIHSGDLLYGDADGVAVIPRQVAEGVIAAGFERESFEAGVMDELRAGKSTLELFGWE